MRREKPTTLLNYYIYIRYDYEEVDSQKANDMIDHLRSLCGGQIKGKTFNGFTVADVDDFEYKDPIDGSISSHQGIRVMFQDGSRFVVRLSGTGSQGATIRLYVEKYSNDPSEYATTTQKALEPLIQVALEITRLAQFTGREQPTVIT